MINLRSYFFELKDLVPKTSEELQRLYLYEREERVERITAILMQIFENLGSYINCVSNNLGNIYCLAEKARRMNLLSKQGLEVVSCLAGNLTSRGSILLTAPRNLTIETNRGNIAVNSDILVDESDFFKTMLAGGMKEAQAAREKQKKAIEAGKCADAKIEEAEVNLELFSPEAFELLMSCLCTPITQEFILPSNNALVMELIRLSLMYEFTEMTERLVAPVGVFIKQHSDQIVANGAAWLDFIEPYIIAHEAPSSVSAALPPSTRILPVSETVKHQAAIKWVEDLTLSMLQHFIVTPEAELTESGLFKIPAASAGLILRGPTAEVFQRLPLALAIKSEADIVTLRKECRRTKEKTSESLLLPLSLCCVDLNGRQLGRINHVSEHFNIELNIEKEYKHVVLTAFGIKNSREAIDFLKSLDGQQANIRQLDLYGIDLDPKDLCVLLADLTKLKAVKITSSEINDFDLLRGIGRLNELESLDLSGCVNLEDPLTALDVLSCRKLRYLNLDHCLNVKALSLELRAPALYNLTHLYLGACRKISGRFLTHSVMRFLVNLKHLDLQYGLREDGDGVTGETMRQLGPCIEKLTGLNLAYCRTITKELLIYLAPRFKNLTFLSLSGCPGVTEESLRVLAPHLKNLQELHLENCGIDMETIQAIFGHVKDLYT